MDYVAGRRHEITEEKRREKYEDRKYEKGGLVGIVLEKKDKERKEVTPKSNTNYTINKVYYEILVSLFLYLFYLGESNSSSSGDGGSVFLVGWQ
jgi:hypothetical protein